MSCPNKPAVPRGSSGPVAAGGFTLLELLIAILLLSIVMVLLYGSIAQISSGTASLNAELENQQETRLLLRMITDDLQAAHYFKKFATGDGRKSGIIVTRESHGARHFSTVQFHANVAARFHRRVNRRADPMIHELAYWAEPAEDDREKMVLKRREDFYLDNDMEEGGISVTIAEGIETFRIELLAEAEKSATLEGDWLEEWDSNEGSKGGMPVAIRVTLALTAAPGAQTREESLDINIESSLGAKP